MPTRKRMATWWNRRRWWRARSRRRSRLPGAAAGFQRASLPGLRSQRSACSMRSMVDLDRLRSFRNLIVTTLEHMANGGVYDQLAGGFHRYSVDERWVVPHFEKMCYDNSEL